eukprot:38573_1
MFPLQSILFVVLSIKLSSVQTAWCQDHYQCDVQSISATNAYCIGYYGCAYSYIQATQSIFCLGDNGCRGYNPYNSGKQVRPTLNAGWNIVCGATDSCYYQQLTAASEINCNGQRACANSILQNTNNAYDITCNSLQSCAGSQISSANDVYCQGRESCSSLSITQPFTTTLQTTITATHALYCAGSSSCAHSEIKADHVDILGDYGGAYADMVVKDWVKVMASNGIKGATISGSGGGGNQYFVQLFGFGSGLGANIYCAQSMTCHIQCLGVSSCASLTVNCATGSYCDVCADSTCVPWANNCLVGPGGIGSNGFYCPTVANLPPGFNIENDIKQKKDERLKDPEYLKFIANRKFDGGDDDFGYKLPSAVDSPRTYNLNHEFMEMIVITVSIFVVGIITALTMVYVCNQCKRKQITNKSYSY